MGLGFMMRYQLWIVLALLMLPLGLAAELEGTIYDSDLRVVHNVLVEINTTPQQRMLSTDGEYTFTIPPGSYVIIASYTENGANKTSTEFVTVEQDGTFVFDLFLLPDIDLPEDDAVLDEGIDFEELSDEDTGNIWMRLIIVLLVVGFAYFAWKMLKKRAIPFEEDEVGQQVIDILHKNHGRMTQKELRKNIPLSEAKISLVVAELEEKGRIEKIKKGRGNILVLRN